MTKHRFTAALVCALCAAGNHAWAADCKPLQLVDSLPLEPVATNDEFTVPVKINDQAETLLVDTGSPYTMLLAGEAKKLDMKLLGSRAVATFVSGAGSATMGTAKSFDLGRQHVEDFDFQLIPGTTLIPDAPPPDGPAGLFSPASTFSRTIIARAAWSIGPKDRWRSWRWTTNSVTSTCPSPWMVMK